MENNALRRLKLRLLLCLEVVSFGDVGKMITQRYSLEEAGKAFEALKSGRDEEGRYVIKAMVGSVPE